MTLLGREFPGRFGGFLSTSTLMAAGEFGDETQVVTIGLAAQYGTSSAIWLGEMLVSIPVSIANAFPFYRSSRRFDRRKAHLVGAALFAFSGVDTPLALTTGFSVRETVVGGVSDTGVGTP